MVDIAGIIIAYPKTSIIAIAIAVTFFSMLVTMLFTDRAKMKELKERQKKCQELMKLHKGNTGKIMEIQKDMMACSGAMMKMSFKPMLITFIPFIIIFGLMKGAFKATTIAGSWFWYYLITAIVAGIFIRKLLKM